MELSIPPWGGLAVGKIGSRGSAPPARMASLAADTAIDPAHSVLDRVAVVLQAQLSVRKYIH